MPLENGLWRGTLEGMSSVVFENIEVTSVQKFLDVLELFQYQFQQTLRNDSFIFRGVSNESWELLPSIYRSCTQKSDIHDATHTGRIYNYNELEILGHFIKEASGFLKHISRDDKFTWLQYAQHFGVPTRLLDFTTNPLIALFFCCKSESEENGAVWIINSFTYANWTHEDFFCSFYGADATRNAIIDSIIKTMDSYSDESSERIEKNKPIMFVPAYIDQRMSAQSSRFLLWGSNPNPLEQISIENNHMKLSPPGMKLSMIKDKRFLAKLVIPPSCKHEIMKQLDILSINDKTVFPGLDGLGRYINNYYKFNLEDWCDRYP